MTPEQGIRRARGLLALAADDPELRSNESRSAATKLLRLVRDHKYTIAPTAGGHVLCGLPGPDGLICVRGEGHANHHSAFNPETDLLASWVYQAAEAAVPSNGLVDAVASAAGTFVGDVIRSSVGAQRRRRRT